MSVLIKGMEMPYGCANCSFVSSPIYDSKGRAIYSCNVDVDICRGKNVTDEVIALYEGALESFPSWCPLIEIPPGAPSAEPEVIACGSGELIAQPDRKEGKWIDETFEPWGLVFHPYRCDQCGDHADSTYDYCPNCGARMETSNE